MPKSGSTLFQKIMIEATGFFPHKLCANFRQEQNILEAKLLDGLGFSSVSCHHTRAFASNVDLLSGFDIRPIVLTRNVFDAIVSFRDHVVADFQETAIFNRPPHFADLDPEGQYDTIIDLVGPWYLGFVSEWQSAAIEKIFVDYDDLIESPISVTATCLQFLDLTVSPPRLEAAVVDALAAGETRLNVGRKGRGDSALSEDQKTRIRRLASTAFPGTDFSRVGL